MSIAKLQEIARDATPQWECAPETDYAIHQQYWNTFNPRLIEKMIAEIKSARRMADNIGLSNTRYDQAREALDAELSPKERENE